jgi:hemoglobin
MTVERDLTTMYEHVGGEHVLQRFVEQFHEAVLRDELLRPLFADARPTHVEHLTAFMVEITGGPTRYSEELGGLGSLIEAHRDLRITEAQRRRFVDLMLDAADAVGMPGDVRFREALARSVDAGATFSMRFSYPDVTFDRPYPPTIGRWRW